MKNVYSNAVEEIVQHFSIGCAIVLISSGDTQGKNRKKLDSQVTLITWSVWRERNTRVFEKVTKPLNVLIDHIKSTKQWVIASAGHFLLDEG